MTRWNPNYFSAAPLFEKASLRANVHNLGWLRRTGTFKTFPSSIQVGLAWNEGGKTSGMLHSRLKITTTLESLILAM